MLHEMKQFVPLEVKKGSPTHSFSPSGPSLFFALDREFEVPSCQDEMRNHPRYLRLCEQFATRQIACKCRCRSSRL